MSESECLTVPRLLDCKVTSFVLGEEFWVNIGSDGWLEERVLTSLSLERRSRLQLSVSFFSGESVFLKFFHGG